MSLQGRVERLNDALVVRYESTRDSEPVRYTLFWPLCGQASIAAHRLEGHAVVSNGHGDWVVAPEDADFWQLRPFRAFVRGNTEAVKVEETPVPCPKVRKGIATRWYRGRWEKLLKSGWTIA